MNKISARKRLLDTCVLGLLSLLVGCYPGAPTSWIPGIYRFSKSGYETTLELKKDGTSRQTRYAPDNSVSVVESRWRVGPLGGHISVDQVVAFYPEPSVDMSKTTFYTPEVDILWGKVCLLVDGNKDLYMCK
jgi:hypothetical protein